MTNLNPFTSIEDRTSLKDDNVIDEFTDYNSKIEPLAIYAQIAYDNLTKIIHNLHCVKNGKSPLIESPGTLIEQKIRSFGIPNNKETTCEYFNDYTYAKLKNYLWKSYANTKNKSGDPLTEKDKKLVQLLCFKLLCIRNFQAHIWHDNTYLFFDTLGAKFIIDHFIAAVNSLSETNASSISKIGLDYITNSEGAKTKINLNYDNLNSNDDKKFVTEYIRKYPLFRNDEEHFKLTVYGRMFFLSFFLTSGDMNNFLSQMKGTKGTNDLKHKATRSIMTYLCHRDGATRSHYNQKKTLLDSLSPDEKKEILSLRKFIKINNYLHNIPQEIVSPKLFPLIENGINLNENDLITKATELGYFMDFALIGIDVQKPKETKKTHNKSQKTIYYIPKNLIEITHKENLDYPIQIELYQFNKLLIYGIHKKGNFQFQQINEGQQTKIIAITIADKLLKFIKGKEKFIVWLETLDNDNSKIDKENEATYRKDMNSYSYFWKGADSKILPKVDNFIGQFCNNFKKGRGSWKETRVSLIKTIKETPIELRFSDIFLETDEILRNENKFMFYSIQYLIDFPVSKHWYWQMETQDEVLTSNTEEMKLGRQIIYSKSLIDNYRISLDDNNQAVMIYLENKNEDIITKTDAKKYQKFLIGHKALKNLIITIQNEKCTPEKDLFNILSKEIANLKNNKSEGFNFLSFKKPNGEEKFIGRSMREFISKTHTTTSGIQALKRIEHILAEFNTIKSKIDTSQNPMNRTNKNEQIMRIYNLFEWKSKFLRKNEYQTMSVYHYTMKDGEKNNFLIKDFEKMFPEEVKSLLKSKDIDDLLNKSILKGIEVLCEFKAALTNSDYSKHKIEFILKKLHLPVSESNLSFVERLDHIPFDIHPELIVHIYYNDENEKAKKKATKCGGYSLSRPFRERHNQAKEKELKISNYDYDTFYNQLEEANVNEYWRKSKKICIGHINEVYIQDILLWEMAKKYYESCNQNLPTILKTKNKNQLCVQNYNNQVFNYKIRDENNKDENNRDISIKMQFFQLDDFLFSESKKDLSLIIQSHINRKRRERSEDNITNNQSYTLNELKEEKRNVFFEAMRFLKNTLNWEKGQIRPVTRELLKKHYNEFKCKASTIEYLSFYTVCIISKPAFHKLYSIMEEIKTEKEILVIQPGDASVISKLKELQNERKKMSDTISDKEYNDYDCLIKKIINARNHALHTNIPSDDVYYKLMKETSVLDFLGVVE